jgi:hypothetical protein
MGGGANKKNKIFFNRERKKLKIFPYQEKKNLLLMDKKSLIFLRWDKKSPIFPYRDKKSGQKSLIFSGGKKIANYSLSGEKIPQNFSYRDIKGVLKILNGIPNPSRLRQQSSLWPWWSENVRVRMGKAVSQGWRLETFILGGDLNEDD